MAKRILIIALILLGTGAVLYLYWPGVRPKPEPLVTRSANAGAPFSLMDADGKAVTESILKGHYTLLYFGFTQCPEICPTTLQKITDALNTLGIEGKTVMPMFVTVDPEHDTPEVMKAYLANFHPRFVGLTGTPDAIKQMEKAYHAFSNKSGDAVAHSDIIYLLDSDGAYVAQFPNEITPTDLVSRLQRELQAQ